MQLFFEQMLPGSQRQRRVTKEQMLLYEPNALVHYGPSPTAGLLLPHLQEFQTTWCPKPTVSTPGNCSALPWSALHPGVGRRATAGAQCPAPWALVPLVEVVLVFLCWAVSGSQTPHGRLQGRQHLAAFLRTPSTKAAGHLPLQQGWPR